MVYSQLEEALHLTSGAAVLLKQLLHMHGHHHHPNFSFEILILWSYLLLVRLELRRDQCHQHIKIPKLPLDGSAANVEELDTSV